MATNTTAGSRANRQKIRQCLRDFNFKELFVEELGWDILNEHPLVIPVDGTTYMLRPLVEKRGVRVFICEPDVEGSIPVDGVLRKIEREVIRYAREAACPAHASLPQGAVGGIAGAETGAAGHRTGRGS